MTWWGKLLGGTFGFMLGGPLGALLGAAFGHQFDKGLELAQQGGAGFAPADNEQIQSAFFTATFSVMGHLAKVDGHVSPDEIDMARAVMARMSLTSELQRAAINLFNAGKQPEFDLDAVLAQFQAVSHRRRNLLRMFVEIQLHAVYADNRVHPEEQRVLGHICARLGFSRLEFVALQARVQAERQFAGAQQGRTASRDALAEAYGVLGVSADVSDEDLKKTYRRLMNQHHPDKLVSRGLPEEMVKLATQKTQEIKAAYERIRQARGAPR